MPPVKNQQIELTITGMTSGGMGVGRLDGFAVFVPGSIPGERILAHVVKVQRHYAYAKLMEIRSASPDRMESDCPVSIACGGCCYRHMTYEAECRIKEQQVTDTFRRIGGYQGPVLPILPSPLQDGYRNKAQIPVRAGRHGLEMGFFAEGSHRVVPHDYCPLSPAIFDEIARSAGELLRRFGIPPYNEETGGGLIRHLYLRYAESTGAVQVGFVVNGRELPHAGQICQTLTERFPEISGIFLNRNEARSNVILGRRCTTLWGSGTLIDTICGLELEIAPLAFYQVNRQAAERLYREAADFAGLTGRETVYDLYCGTGVIGLSMAAQAGRVIGVEIVPDAVANAQKNAKRNGIENALFYTADVAHAAARLAADCPPDVVLLDPPRRGCDPAVIEQIAGMHPDRIVMIACNPASAARDCARFAELGYPIARLRPVDLFPRTGNVETAILLSRG